MTSQKVAQNLEKYFNAKIIGSFIFVKNGLLDIADINDIDISIPQNVEKNVHKYLTDLGYEQTIKKGTQIGYDEKSRRAIWQQLPQGDFKKKGRLPIDVIIMDKGIYTIPMLIGEKYRRGTKSDIEQILKVIGKKSNTYKNLVQYKNATVGLYAMRKHPADTNIDWIIKNAFKIEF